MNSNGKERETKLGVSDAFTMPDLADVGLPVIDRGTVFLRATYLDTDALDLFRLHHGLRHRTSGGDTGRWTLKGPSALDGDGMVRSEFEMDAPGSLIPPAVLGQLPSGIDPAALRPVAWLRTHRHIRDVLAADGRRLLEIADDDAEILDENGAVVSRFREVEVEVLDPAGIDAAAVVVSRLRAAGATDPAAPSKLMRALSATGHLRGIEGLN